MTIKFCEMAAESSSTPPTPSTLPCASRSRLAEINALLAVKMGAGEAATSPRWPGIHAFIEAELASNVAEPVQALPTAGQAPLDAMLFDTVLQHDRRAQEVQPC